MSDPSPLNEQTAVGIEKPVFKQAKPQVEDVPIDASDQKVLDLINKEDNPREILTDIASIDREKTQATPADGTIVDHEDAERPDRFQSMVDDGLMTAEEANDLREKNRIMAEFDRKVRPLIKEVDDNLAHSPILSQLSASDEVDSNTEGMPAAKQRINNISHANLSELTSFPFFWDLYRNPELLKAVFLLPGSTSEYQFADLLSPSFWRNDFTAASAALSQGNELVLIHNMGNLESLKFNIDNGVGALLQVGSEDQATTLDILREYLVSNQDRRQTFTMLGLDHPFYRSGSYQGGEGDVQIQFDARALRPRTVFFPSDTGHPDANLGIESLYYESQFIEREHHALNLTDATTLLLLRHIQMLVQSQLTNQGGSIGENHFGILEGNVLGEITMTPENTRKVIINQGVKQDDRQHETYKYITSRLTELGITTESS